MEQLIYYAFFTNVTEWISSVEVTSVRSYILSRNISSDLGEIWIWMFTLKLAERTSFHPYHPFSCMKIRPNFMIFLKKKNGQSPQRSGACNIECIKMYTFYVQLFFKWCIFNEIRGEIFYGYIIYVILHVQLIDVKANDVWVTANEAFGKYSYSTELGIWQVVCPTRWPHSKYLSVFLVKVIYLRHEFVPFGTQLMTNSSVARSAVIVTCIQNNGARIFG